MYCGLVRRPAAMKKNYVIDDDEDDEDEVDVNASDDDDDYDLNDDVQDEGEYQPQKKSIKAAAPALAPKATKSTATKRATKVSMFDPFFQSLRRPQLTETGDYYLQTTTANANSTTALYSPDRLTPQHTKRAR